MSLTTRNLDDGEVAGDEEGTTVSASTSRIECPPKPKLYRPLGASAMAHGGAPTNPNARCSNKAHISFLEPWRTFLRYCYRLR